MEKITPAQLVIPKQGEHIRVIELHAGELLTSERTASWNTDTSAKDWADGINPDDDIIKIVAIERHKNTGHLGKGFLGGYGLKKAQLQQVSDTTLITWSWPEQTILILP